jgi:hypothetical protein
VLRAIVRNHPEYEERLKQLVEKHDELKGGGLGNIYDYLYDKNLPAMMEDVFKTGEWESKLKLAREKWKFGSDPFLKKMAHTPEELERKAGKIVFFGGRPEWNHSPVRNLRDNLDNWIWAFSMARLNNHSKDSMRGLFTYYFEKSPLVAKAILMSASKDVRRMGRKTLSDLFKFHQGNEQAIADSLMSHRWDLEVGNHPLRAVVRGLQDRYPDHWDDLVLAGLREIKERRLTPNELNAVLVHIYNGDATKMVVDLAENAGPAWRREGSIR